VVKLWFEDHFTEFARAERLGVSPRARLRVLFNLLKINFGGTWCGVSVVRCGVSESKPAPGAGFSCSSLNGFFDPSRIRPGGTAAVY